MQHSRLARKSVTKPSHVQVFQGTGIRILTDLHFLSSCETVIDAKHVRIAFIGTLVPLKDIRLSVRQCVWNYCQFQTNWTCNLI